MQIVKNNNKALYVENGCYNTTKTCSSNAEIPGGRGVIKGPLGTEIPKGWGVQTEKSSVGGVWIFSGTTH